MKHLLFYLLIIIIFPTSVFAQRAVTLASPDKNLVFNFRLKHTKPFYSIAYKGKTLVDYSTLSLLFEDDSFIQNIQISQPVYRDTTEEYDLITGKTSHVHTQYKEVTIPM